MQRSAPGPAVRAQHASLLALVAALAASPTPAQGGAPFGSALPSPGPPGVQRQVVDALPRRYDMGESARQPVAGGFLPVGPESLYEPGRGYGWSVPPATGLARPAVAKELVRSEGPSFDRLIRDNCQGSATFVFRQDLPPGEYHCVALLGDVGDPPALRTPLEGLCIDANGRRVVSDAFARLLRKKGSFAERWGAYKRVAFVCSVLEGEHALELAFSSSVGGASSLMALEIYEHRPPPFDWDHAAQELTADPQLAGGVGVQAFLDAFNAADYEAARSALDAFPAGQRLAQVWGYCWLAGWLTGAEHPVDEALLNMVESALAGPLHDPDDPRVVGLLSELRAFRKGELLYRLRAYTVEANSLSAVQGVSLEEMVANLSAGVHLLEQMDDDVLALAPDPHATASPFAPLARWLIARNLWSRKTFMGYTPGTEGALFNEYAVGLFQELWERVRPLDPGDVPNPLLLFPKAHETTALAYLMVTHLEDTYGPTLPWDGSLPWSSLPADAWWRGRVDLGPDPAGTPPPSWAAHQRKYARMFRNLASWWVEERLFDGEFGGGPGDDPELAVLAVPTITRTESPYHRVEEGFRTLLRKGLLDEEHVDQENGYWHQPDPNAPPSEQYIDAEHGAEFTTNPLFVLMPTIYGEPLYLEFSMRTLRNMFGAADWTLVDSVPSPPRRRFRAWHYSSSGWAGDGEYPASWPQWDIPHNWKVLLPAFHLTDFNDLPKAVQLLDQYAWAWRDAAMDQSGGKPSGVFPVAIDPVTGVATGPTWWENSEHGNYKLGSNDDWMYAGLHAAYERSQLASRWQLLEPLLDAVRHVDSNPPNEDPPFDPSNPGWVSDRIKLAVADSAMIALASLLRENALGADFAQLVRVISQYGSPYSRFLIQDDQSPSTPQPKDLVEEMFADASVWLENYWPLATTAVSYTDRVKFEDELLVQGGSPQVHEHLYTTVAGAPFSVVPAYPVSWSNGDQANGESDFALLVSEYQPSEPSGGGFLKALVYNFSAQPRDLRLHVWRGLSPGLYTLRIGPDVSPQDDQIDDATPSEQAVLITQSGTVLPLDDVPSGQLQVLELEQLGVQPGSPRFDLGVGEDDFELAGTKLRVRVHNLGLSSFDGTGAVAFLIDADTGAALTGVQPVPPIPAVAPGTLDPSWGFVEFDYQPAIGDRIGARIRVDDLPPGFPEEITERNNLAFWTVAP